VAWVIRVGLVALSLSIAPGAPAAGGATTAQTASTPLDRVLDTYVREGHVYYRALQSERKLLDAYVRALDLPAALVAAWPKAKPLAFWVNAYNALVLQTVIDKYPITGKAEDYPAASIRQIPGAFEQRPHRVAGQTLTCERTHSSSNTARSTGG